MTEQTDYIPEVNTREGAVRGFCRQGAHGPVCCFYGIPYAQPPVGPLRWRDAVPPAPRSEALNCTLPLKEQKSSLQWGSNLLPYFRTLRASEDCLYLNITTPSLKPEGKLPVLVWLHGGGLFGGSGSEEVYNLPLLPEQGCVLVTVTTRLGAFGLLSAGALGSREGGPDAGNFILSDLIQALQWVRENISAFGGDPDCVTIAGESGGAQKVHALMASPRAIGLFCRAILQSGTASAVPFADAVQQGDLLLQTLGVATPEAARAVPARTVLEAANALNLNYDFIVDGSALPSAPADARKGDVYSCDAILGFNSGEKANMLQVIGGVSGCRAVLDRLAEDGHLAYAYELDQVPATWRELGFHCVHSMDLAYLFGEYENTEGFYDGGPWEQQFMFFSAGERLDPGRFISPVMDADDMALSRCMMELWVSFAKTGVPESGNLQWRPWRKESQDCLVLRCRDGLVPTMRAGLGE